MPKVMDLFICKKGNDAKSHYQQNTNELHPLLIRPCNRCCGALYQGETYTYPLRYGFEMVVNNIPNPIDTKNPHNRTYQYDVVKCGDDYVHMNFLVK